MGDDDFVIQSQHVVTPEGVMAGGVHVVDGVIRRIMKDGEHVLGVRRVEVGEGWVLPGVVDLHVHCNEPGRTEWEGFATATAAAAAGGVTTLVDMPLNSSPVTTSLANFDKKLEAATGKLAVDVAFHAGLIRGNADEIPALLDAGCVGVKAFLVDSGIDEFPAATEEDLRAILPELARRGVPLLVHAELEGPCQTPAEGDRRRYASYLASRPASWEIRAIELMIRLCRETGAPVHIVHLSAAEALPMLAEAKGKGLPITVETCPHYLYFNSERIADGDTRFKCAPPIRDDANREGLWRGLEAGIIDLIASDHSPCEPALKDLRGGDWMTAWGGISSLQWILSIVWTESRRRGIPLEQVMQWLAARPARVMRLDKKGRLAAGCDADLTVFYPDQSFVVETSQIRHRHKVTPYEGERLFGVVRETYVRGRLVFPHDAGSARLGQIVRRSQSPLERLNAMEPEEARNALLRCCGAKRWVSRLMRERPFSNAGQLAAASESAWEEMGRDDWMEAFSHHPRIGDLAGLRQRFASTAGWASTEQAGTASATEEDLVRLAEGNEAYERKFGYIFIVCATGKSAAEMTSILESRLSNPSDKELAIAAGEQMKITRLRLEKLLT